MSTIHTAIAFVPISIYLLLIGALRMRNKPLVTTGWRDIVALGLASLGLVMIGPVQLFFPAQAAAQYHHWVWLALLILYGLAILLLMLASKPRLIAYGLNASEFRNALEVAAKSIDPNAYWDGDVLSLPSTTMQLALEPTASTRVQQVVHFGLLQDLAAWIKLERAVVKQTAQLRCPPSAAGLPLLIGGLLLLFIVVAPIVRDPATALEGLQRFVNR
ncbi:MAG TPA: hypothetical protein DDW52_19015 [Planctomycetaceae bacterium]|nr:hypothetical protein [Planctomycetaceae bacterium]